MISGFKKGSEITLRAVDLPSPAAGQIRVGVDACGVCGTDLHIRGDEPAGGKPFGHEVAGTVLGVGAGVTNVSVGERIALDSSTPCGECDACLSGARNMCWSPRSFSRLGYSGFAEELIAPAISAVPAGALPPDVACLQEPLEVAIDMARVADIGKDSNVLVIGAGPIGLMCAALCRHLGAARVFVSGTARRPARVALAGTLADRFLKPELLESVELGCEVDRILVTAPPRTLPIAFRVAAKGAIISYIGIEYGDGAMCTFDANEFHFKKLQLRPSFSSPATQGSAAIKYLAGGLIDTASFISHRFPLDRLSEAIDTARNSPDAIKVIVAP